VCAFAAAEDPDGGARAIVEAFAIDRATGALVYKSDRARLGTSRGLGDRARVARRPNGELLFQSVSSEGLPSSELVCARPDGHVESIALGLRRRPVLDVALGDAVLAHHESRDGRVTIAAFDVDRAHARLTDRILGRRAVERWSIETGDLGGATTLYAGAGRIVARGSRAVEAIRLS
jgi:hypothetical protein